jgi:arylsulfatase A-like enzyme
MSNLARKPGRGEVSEAQSKDWESTTLSRREFLKGAFVSGAATIVANTSFSPGSSLGVNNKVYFGKDGEGNFAPASRPNIVYIFSDQHRNCSWPGGGTTQIQTPNLNRLAGQGVVFSNCISNYPLCSPHRASLLTGRFPQAHSIKTNVTSNKDPLPTTEPSIARALKNEGYVTGYVGKWHLYPGAGSGILVPPGDHRHGFDDYWRACHNYRNRYDTRTYDDEGTEIVLPDYAPKCQMDMVMGFIQEHASEPFCIFLSWHPPHPPFTEAPSRFEDLYPIDQIQVRPNVPEDQIEPALLENYRGYYAHISAQDEEIGRLMGKLDELGIADNTIVLYSSDHGEMLGSLGYMEKGKPWEESINVPFVIRWPAGIPANRRLDTLFSTVDITPTLLSLAGVPIPGQMQGLDLSRVLKGQDGSVPASTFIMRINPDQLPDDKHVGDWRGVRTLGNTYAKRIEEAGVAPWILYDNQRDPYQMTNLINDPRYADIQSNLEFMLFSWLIRVGDYEFVEDSFRVYMPRVCKTVGESTATSTDGLK